MWVSNEVLVLNIYFVLWKSSGDKFETRLASDVWRNLNESINRISKVISAPLISSTLIFLLNVIYFSSVDGIHVVDNFLSHLILFSN